jgi:hypothetical protein
MSSVPASQKPYPSPYAGAKPPRSKARRWVIGSITVVVVAPLLWTCGRGAYHNYKITSAAVSRFHQQLDAGDVESIYGEATDEFRRWGSRESALKFLETVHQKMGNSGGTSRTGFHVNWQNNIVSVNETFDTKFALGQAQETFVWIVDHDQAHLQRYQIDSANLR